MEKAEPLLKRAQSLWGLVRAEVCKLGKVPALCRHKEKRDEHLVPFFYVFRFYS